MNLSAIGDIFFPPACVACQVSLATGVICQPCRNSIAVFDTLFCGTCTARLPERKKICHLDAPYLLGAAGEYEDDALKALIHALKFQNIARAADPLGKILAEYVTKLALDLHQYIITPLPLSLKRRRARGFNQSALIARGFAKELGLSVTEDVIIRTEHRRPQSETEDIIERRENVRGVFSLHHIDAASGKNIVIIDDVTTSGTTFGEAARVLKAGGAKKIIALAVARA